MSKNETMLLKNENIKQSNSLCAEDKQTIKDIMKSMSIFRVSSYDAQVIQRDLIGMAQESRLRNSSLKEVIGDDIKGFTNEIINNSNGPCKTEILLNLLLKLSGYFFVWFTALAFGAYGSLSWKANPIIYIYYVGVVLAIFMTEGMITPMFITEKGLKRKMQSLVSIAIFAALTSIVFFLNDSQYTIDFKGGYIIIGSGMVYLAARYLDLKNTHRLAKEKKNYIQDLE
ncbi:MAG: hypothetical protein ACOZCL_03740 [Bacillota bacterium]